MRKQILPVTAIALLAACSGAPSEKEITAAVSSAFDDARQAAASTTGFLGMPQAGAEAALQLHGVKSLGCREDGERGGYRCDVEVDVTAPMVGRSKQTSNVRLVKGSEGWRLVQ